MNGTGAAIMKPLNVGVVLLLLARVTLCQALEDCREIEHCGDYIGRADVIASYATVLVWALIQMALKTRLKTIRKREVLFIGAMMWYMQIWIYLAAAWMITAIVLASSYRFFSTMLSAVAAKTIAFLVQEKIPMPSEGVGDCLEAIWQAERVKWGLVSKKAGDEEEGKRIETVIPVDDESLVVPEKAGDEEEGKLEDAIETVIPVDDKSRVWVKFVIIQVNDPCRHKLRKLLRKFEFDTGAWEGIYESESLDKSTCKDPSRLIVNAWKDTNKERIWTQDELGKLYPLTLASRQAVKAKGCIFSNDEFRLDGRWTKKSWYEIFIDECSGEWHYLLAWQLQTMLPTEVLSVPLPANRQFLKSNVYGRLRKRGLTVNDYTPSLTDVNLFEAAIHEKMKKDKLGVDFIESFFTIIKTNDEFDAAARAIFEFMCEL